MGVAFRAFVAFKRLFAGVLSFMDVKIAPICKAFVAFTAFVGLLARVNSSMDS